MKARFHGIYFVVVQRRAVIGTSQDNKNVSRGIMVPHDVRGQHFVHGPDAVTIEKLLLNEKLARVFTSDEFRSESYFPYNDAG